MASLKALKIRIGSVKSTQKITKAMKMVAAAKLRRAQSNAEQGRPYSQRLSDVVASLASRITVGPQSPRLIAGTGDDQRHLIVVASSDRGLAGPVHPASAYFCKHPPIQMTDDLAQIAVEDFIAAAA